VSTEGPLFASGANIRVRNDYAFWIPLDDEFMGVMAEYAQIYNVTYMSPFEGELLFAYLNYNSSTANLTNDQATQTVDQAASHNIQSNIISPFGAYYQNLISPSNGPTPNPTFTPTNAPTQAPTTTASPHASSPTQVPTATPYFSQSPTPTPSIPEFSTWIILPPFVVATLLSIIFRRKITKK
jgi:hypothetical protein